MQKQNLPDQRVILNTFAYRALCVLPLTRVVHTQTNTFTSQGDFGFVEIFS